MPRKVKILTRVVALANINLQRFWDKEDLEKYF